MPTISSRTPEGWPQRCPVCGELAMTEPSSPLGDSCCPRCGELLVWLRDRLGRDGVAEDLVTLSASFRDFGADSLDVVELVMELEEELDIVLSDEEAAQINTVADAIRFIEERRRKKREQDDEPS